MNIADLTSRAPRTDMARRAQLLAAFDQSGLSAAAFARKHSIHYTTFCGWRQRRSWSTEAPGFVQVELEGPPAAASLLVEIGTEIRLWIRSHAQLELAAGLLRRLTREEAC